MVIMSEKSSTKSTNDYCQSVLKELLKEEHNKYCADCQTKSPQWASWNIGVFICIKCAGIHRNLGVHISKVKSITLDTWNNDHIFMLEKIGNKKANEVYEATLPKNFCRNRDIESWIRCKYEYKSFMLKDWIPPTQDKKVSKKKHCKSSKSKKQISEESAIDYPVTNDLVRTCFKDEPSGDNNQTKSAAVADANDGNSCSSENKKSVNIGLENVLNEERLCYSVNLIDCSNDVSTKSRRGHTLCSSLWE